MEMAMALPLDWRADPLVVIEDQLRALLVGVPAHLCARALGQEYGAGASPLPHDMAAFADALHSGFIRILAPTGFELDAEAALACAAAAEALQSLLTSWPQSEVAPLLSHFQYECVPRSDTALNAVRRVFIGGVLQRQAAHAALSEAAMLELSNLSRSIQFVAVNASIEEARSGPSGRAFGLLADEIRQLAQQSGKVIHTQRA